ncbi:S-adenosylmethionine decarboxylase [Rhizobium sp. BK602]|uniref:S-adenosylmethionine decarboxylase family protein n=1 Tax=Rhizobium sp. BK602 TaxID=2586986 RepID=UPI0016125DDB|nr:S-adenosylmethionine decarboxylase [Rhizobium sp. BK602]MBB3610889.1 S-adenosylmethionine decarboxylase [Rhizobium sp. BK602]
MGELRSHRLSAVVSAPDEILNASADSLLTLARQAVADAELTTISWAKADFEPQGASIILLLQESHVALHAWPEYGKLTVDIHVCDFNRDNLGRARQVAEALSFADRYPDNRGLWSVQTMRGDGP